MASPGTYTLGRDDTDYKKDEYGRGPYAEGSERDLAQPVTGESMLRMLGIVPNVQGLGTAGRPQLGIPGTNKAFSPLDALQTVTDVVEPQKGLLKLGGILVAPFIKGTTRRAARTGPKKTLTEAMKLTEKERLVPKVTMTPGGGISMKNVAHGTKGRLPQANETMWELYEKGDKIPSHGLYAGSMRSSLDRLDQLRPRVENPRVFLGDAELQKPLSHKNINRLVDDWVDSPEFTKRIDEILPFRKSGGDTAEGLKQRLKVNPETGRTFDEANVRPIESPKYMDNATQRQLDQRGYIFADGYANLIDENPVFLEYLQSRGYDGIFHINHAEDIGNPSVLLFDDKTFKPKAGEAFTVDDLDPKARTVAKLREARNFDIIDEDEYRHLENRVFKNGEHEIKTYLDDIFSRLDEAHAK